MIVGQQHLFAVPVAKVFVPETPALKRQFLPEILRRYEAGNYERPGLWETDRVHSSFDAKREDQVIAELPEAYQRLLRQFVEHDRVRVQIWHNVYWHRREYQERHHHIPCHYSFIHFLAFDHGRHKPPSFYDPARMMKAYCRHDAMPAELWTEAAQIDVYEGDALVFPSYLEHSVPPRTYTAPRVTVSINVTLLD